MKSISTLRTIFLITVITFPFLTSGQNSTTAGVTTLTGTSQRTGEPDLISGSALAGQNLTPYQPSGWDNKSMSVSVYNVLGSKIFSKEYFVNEQVLFDLSGHSPGMYLVRLKTGNIEISKNVILNKLK